jgi:hypothetical protein
MIKKKYYFVLLVILLFSMQAKSETNNYAQFFDKTANIFFTKSSDSISKLLGTFGGKGETEVNLTAGKKMKPMGSISITRAIKETENSMFFNQTQINNYFVRGKDRLALNLGFGYRKLSDDNSSFWGANIFYDRDAKSNTRASLGLEYETSPFSLTANKYMKISGSNKVGTFTERVLGGYDINASGQIPFLPWANINLTNYKWNKINNSKDSKGNKLSGEFYITKNLTFEAGVDDNDLDGRNNFASISFIWPGNKKPTFSDKIISNQTFEDSDVSQQMLTKIKRNNRIVLESEGAGVVIARLD